MMMEQDGKTLIQESTIIINSDVAKMLKVKNVQGGTRSQRNTKIQQEVSNITRRTNINTKKLSINNDTTGKIKKRHQNKKS